MPGRTDNEIKNYWHTHLKKRVHQHLVGQKILPSSVQLQTPLLRSDSQRTPKFADASNHPEFESNGNDQNIAVKFHQNFSGLEYCISAHRPVKQNSYDKALRVLAETNLKRSVKDSSKTKSVGTAADSRLQFLSTGESITEPGDDSIKDDMVFWYNLFVHAGKSQES